jgi:K+-transporting ATPase KdpF subunit
LERQVEEKVMGMESIIMLAVSVLTAVYLVYALLRPEKF